MTQRLHAWGIALFVFVTATAQTSHNPFGHALVPDMIADASIQLIGDTFYCYATTDGYGRGLETSGPPVVWKSKDMRHWSFEGTYFPSAATEKYWAPSKVVQAPAPKGKKGSGKWYIYPTVNGIMHVGVADSPDGPFRLVSGEDRFTKPYAEAATLLREGNREGIDAEVFVDDDGKAYIFWGKRHVARLGKDMTTVTDIRELKTRRTEYSEGPIFFKRKGIYYYLYTIGGSENYEYYYQMSRTSPFGPYETPANDRVSTTSIERGVFGPGHGCVFNVGDDYYFAFLEFSRNSTNRQTYVNPLTFNDDGTIRPVEVTLGTPGPALPATFTASSTRKPHAIRYFGDSRCQRTEYFDADLAGDGAYGSRWMAADGDNACWLTADLGAPRKIKESRIYFVRPTAGHAYRLEGSIDGLSWETCGGHADVQMRSPHTDKPQAAYRYLRVRITEGICGVWDWEMDFDDEANGPLTREWGDWKGWGQQAGGSFLNPVIPADYSDLDCIRVGDDYYAISSTMQFSPGMTVLHSRDLVNWEIAGNAVADLNQISNAMTWQEMDRYGRGIWAGTLRYHNGRFYLFFGTPDEGFFMTSAERAEGPWEPLTPLLQERGWNDCSAIWDEKGQAWFVGTCFGDGYKTYIFPMAKDASSIDRTKARLVNEGFGREASKLIRHDGYYYLVFSEHRDGIGRYVMAKRDRKMTGSFNEEKQLLNACREANEPNQGGIIEGPDGNWYFLTHHGSGDWSGRIISLLPVQWKDGWPMMGREMNMVWSGQMPMLTDEQIDMNRSEEFDQPTLAPQWQWNYEPRATHFSLTERPGWMRLRAFRPIETGKLLKAGNTLTQRSFRSRINEVTVKLDISHLADGQHAGLCHFAEHSGCLGVVRQDGKTYLELRIDDRSTRGSELTSGMLFLRSTWGLDGQSLFYYSTDGQHFTPFGSYRLSWGFYRGDRIGVYSFNDLTDDGYVDVNYFHYDMTK